MPMDNPSISSPDQNTSDQPVSSEIKMQSIDDRVKKSKRSYTKIILLGAAFVIMTIIVIIVFLLQKDKIDDKNSENNSNPEKIVIGLSLATLRTERWQRDRDYIIEEAKKYNAIVNVANANDDSALQASQVENLVLQGVDVLIIIPIDGDQAATMVEMASQHNVKVIAYDRLIKGTDLAYYVSFDSTTVGQMQAQGVLDVVAEGKFAYIGGSDSDNNAHLLRDATMEILQPYIDDGKIELVIDTYTPDWKQEEAYKTVKTYLESGGTLDAIIAANDGTAFGSIQALQEYDLAGKIPVSGQDAELSACQRIVEGTQTLTVYKPLDVLARRAVTIALAVAEGNQVDTNAVVNNSQIDVPSFLIEPIMVTKESMLETIVKSGFHSFEDVYKQVPANQRPEYSN